MIMARLRAGTSGRKLGQRASRHAKGRKVGQSVNPLTNQHKETWQCDRKDYGLSLRLGKAPVDDARRSMVFRQGKKAKSRAKSGHGSKTKWVMLRGMIVMPLVRRSLTTHLHHVLRLDYSRGRRCRRWHVRHAAHIVR